MMSSESALKEKDKKRKQKYYNKSCNHDHNKYARWNKKEKNILKNFKGNDYELSIILNRSIQAIENQRLRLKEL